MLLLLNSFNKHKRHLNLLLLVGFFLLALSGCESGIQPKVTPDVVADTRPVQILVWDDAKQVPLTRANVTLTIPNNVFPVKETDNSGRAVFDVRQELLSLTATIVVQKEGYQLQRHIVTLDSAPVITVYLVLNNATAVPRETPTVTPVPPTLQPVDTSTPVPPDTAVPTETPEPTNTPTQTPLPPSPNGPITLTPREGAATVFVLAGPGVENVKLGTLEKNESGEVIGRTEQNEWLQIITNRGIQGWVADCEITISYADLGSIPVTWGGMVTARNCGVDSTSSGTGISSSGNCVNVSLSRTDWPGREFDDITLAWSNVPPTATRLKLWVTGPTNDGSSAFVVHPTFSETNISYEVELFKFEDGDFKLGATYTYVVQPFNASNQIICTTQGTFVP